MQTHSDSGDSMKETPLSLVVDSQQCTFSPPAAVYSPNFKAEATKVSGCHTSNFSEEKCFFPCKFSESDWGLVQKENTPPLNMISLTAEESPEKAKEVQSHKLPVADSPTQAKHIQAASRRRAAAEWIEQQTGSHLPTSSDHALRGALRDGVLLCRLMNKIEPNIIPKVWILQSCA